MRARTELLSLLRSKAAPPVLIAGGGINGVGVFRDLALQGIPCLLAERSDFASGTSAAPSRLIHGGLRYLETGEFALVRESVEERNLMLLNAPHYVRPLRCWVPADNWLGGSLSAVARFLRLTRTPGAKGMLVVKLGLMIYDLFGKHHRTMPQHRLVSMTEARQRVPGLAKSVKAVAEYFDARVSHAERLALELVADAERDCPEAMAIPYLGVEGTEDGRVILRDEIGGETLAVAPRIVVNCAGAWADRVNGRLGIETRLIGGTRGSHLLIEDRKLAGQLGDMMFYFPTSDNRACLIYAFDESHVFLGATDIRCDEPDNVACTDEEIHYLLTIVREILPECRYEPGDIAFAVSGVRPLPRTEGDVAGAISRDHSFKVYKKQEGRPFAVLTLVGGKWTTYRICAEQIADKVLGMVGQARRASTKRLAIGGGKGFPVSPPELASKAEAFARVTGLTAERARTLYDRYGTAAETVAASFARQPEQMLEHVPNYSAEEIRYLAVNERVTRLSDIILRRTLIGLHGHASENAVAEIAAVARVPLAWDTERTSHEIDMVNRLLQTVHRVPVRQ